MSEHEDGLDLARLRAARTRSRLQQIEVAAILGVAKSLPGQWERGEKSPSVEVLKRLLQLLGVSADWLLGMDHRGEHAVHEQPNYLPPAPHARYDNPEAILSDYTMAPGLRDLASAKPLAGALAITPEEWAALASLSCEEGLTLDGYLGLLVLLRNVSLRAERGRLLKSQRSPAPE